MRDRGCSGVGLRGMRRGEGADVLRRWPARHGRTLGSVDAERRNTGGWKGGSRNRQDRTASGRSGPRFPHDRCAVRRERAAKPQGGCDANATVARRSTPCRGSNRAWDPETDGSGRQPPRLRPRRSGEGQRRGDGRTGCLQPTARRAGSDGRRVTGTTGKAQAGTGDPATGKGTTERGGETRIVGRRRIDGLSRLRAGLPGNAARAGKAKPRCPRAPEPSLPPRRHPRHPAGKADATGGLAAMPAPFCVSGDRGRRRSRRWPWSIAAICASADAILGASPIGWRPPALDQPAATECAVIDQRCDQHQQRRRIGCPSGRAVRIRLAGDAKHDRDRRPQNGDQRR